MISRVFGIEFYSRRPVSVSGVVRVLSKRGWRPVEPLGVTYAVEGPVGNLAWDRAEPGDAHTVLTMLDAPERSRQKVGLCVYRQESDTGGQLLFSTDRLTVTFLPTLDRRTLPFGHDLTDVPWYLAALLPGLVEAGLSGYKAEDVEA